MELLVFVAGLLVGISGVLLVTRRGRASTSAGAGSPAASGEVAELRAAFDALATGVVVVGRHGKVLVRNASATTLGGALHSDVLLHEALEAHLMSTLGGQPRRQVLDLHGPPRQVVVIQGRALTGGGALVTVDDVSERARLDAVRTDFVANISHELRTPVGALAVLAEALSDADDPEVVRRLSGKMVDEAHRVARTIDDLLELSRIELGGKAVREHVDVWRVLTDAADRVQPFADRSGIHVDVEEPADELVAVGDRRQLVSALGNLMENAVKYSETGQRVVVSAVRQGSWIEFVVADCGIGIPARDLDRVFERFYRVDRARRRETGGTGLGLAIVRHVATNHDGEVTVTSHEGEGSTFVLRIPAAPLDLSTSERRIPIPAERGLQP